MDLVMVGAGEAARKHWIEGIIRTPRVNVVAVVDQDIAKARRVATMFSGKVPVFRSAHAAIPPLPSNPVALVLTPDHFPTIVDLVKRGWQRLIVEKPLVSRDDEIAALKKLMADNPAVKIFAVDQYIAKTVTLQCLTGLLSRSDPRGRFLKTLHQSHFSATRGLLGSVEGVSIAVVESGGFCLPDLAKRSWLRNDPEIGGMLRDLGTHAFAPLIAAGIITSAAEVRLVHLTKLDDDSSLLPVLSPREVEMHVFAMLRENGVPVTASFGKVPGEGGIWALTVRFKNGEYRAGLRSGQPAVVALNDGYVASETLSVSPVEYLIHEAKLFFNGDLPGFDGNIGAVLGSLEICARIREKYFADMRR